MATVLLLSVVVRTDRVTVSLGPVFFTVDEDKLMVYLDFVCECLRALFGGFLF